MQRRNFLAGLAGWAGVARAQPAPLYLLTYDHGGLVLWGMDHFAERLRDAAQWLDRYPGFKIGLDNEAYTYDYLAEHDPKLLEELRGMLKRYAGRFGIGTCTYGQPLATFINEESNIRQIEYALEGDRRHFGRAPQIYLMSEHAMHCQMPQILAGLGFQGAIMRTHFMMYGYNPVFDAPVGWWTAPDGTRIATVPTYPGEGAEFGRTTSDNWILTRCPGKECKGSLPEFRRQFAHINPLLATRADDSGLRREGLVQETEGRPEYRWVLLEDLPAILPKPAAEFRTGPNDFTVRMPWGYCGNEIWNRSRRAEAAVLTAERMAAVELLTGGENREAALEKAWKNLLVAQHHDVQICGLLPDAHKFLGASLEASGAVRDASLRYAAARMQGGRTAQVTVFNPRSWAGAEWVEVECNLPRHWAKALKVLHQGGEVPCALVSALRSSDDSIFQARLAVRADAPPLGFASYEIAPGEAAPAAALPYWEIQTGPRGGIAAVVNRATGQAALHNARFAGVIEGRACESEGRWRNVPAQPGERWSTMREEGFIGGIPYRLQVTAWADSPRLDFRVTFEIENQRIGQLSQNKRDARSPFLHEEKLRFRFVPEAGADAVGVRDLPFIVTETPARYIEGNYWAALSGARGGVAIFNRGTMGTVRESDGSLSIPLAYAMYYIWGTRMLSGEYSYEFALWPFEGPWAEADLHRHALEYNYPYAAMTGEPGNGKLASRVAPYQPPAEGAIVSAFYTRAGQAYARMYEYRGREVKSPLAFRPWQIRTEHVGG